MDRRPSPSSRNQIQLIEGYFLATRISTNYRLRVKMNPAHYFEQAHFTIWLVEEQSGDVSACPSFVDLFSAGRTSQTTRGWIDGDFFDMTAFSDGT